MQQTISRLPAAVRDFTRCTVTVTATTLTVDGIGCTTGWHMWWADARHADEAPDWPLPGPYAASGSRASGVSPGGHGITAGSGCCRRRKRNPCRRSCRRRRPPPGRRSAKPCGAPGLRMGCRRGSKPRCGPRGPRTSPMAGNAPTYESIPAIADA
jgi:hypothetical protein